MTGARILVVEDEGIVAMEIKDRLEGLGYKVSELASSGEEAIQKAERVLPDLVLMDIILKGSMDGVEAAEKIRANLGIPVVYLTAYSDDSTLQRAKIAEPFGYILKPFDERELYSTIEMALYKHKMERKLMESEQWLATTLKSIGDAVIATDKGGFITFMNPAAEKLTGWKKDDALGIDLCEVFKVVDEDTLAPIESPVTRALSSGSAASLKDNSILMAIGKEVPIDYCATSISDGKGGALGTVLVFRDITERKQAEKDMRIRDSALASAVNAIAISDLDGRLTYVNKSFLRMWEYNQDEVLGRPMFQFWQSKDVAAEVQGALLDKGWIGELIAIRKDGTPFDVQLSASIVTDKNDRPICVMNSFIDITEIKRAEEEMKNYTTKLERADSDLEKIYDKISSDLKSALGSVQHLNTLLSSEYEANLDEKARRSLMEAVDATERMNQLLDELGTLNIPISIYISLIELYQAKIKRFREWG